MLLKIFHKIKSGSRLIPAFLIYLYLLFGLLDLLTTWLASPDLKYEGNWIIRTFNLGWKFIFLNSFVSYSFVILALFLSLDYVNRFFLKSVQQPTLKLIRKPLRNFKFLTGLFFIGIFFSHLLNVGHIIFNNYLGYIYLNVPDSWLRNISEFYIERQKYFLFYIQYVLYIPGYVIAFLKVENMRKKAVRQHGVPAPSV